MDTIRDREELAMQMVKKLQQDAKNNAVFMNEIAMPGVKPDALKNEDIDH